MSNDYFKAQGWFKDYARNSQDSRGMFQRLVKEDEEAFKLASAETDKIKAMINKKYGPGTMKYGSEIPQPDPRKDVIEIDAINAFMKRNPAAEGGRMYQGQLIPQLVTPNPDGSRPGYAPVKGWKEEKAKFFKWLADNPDYDFANSSTPEIIKKSGTKFEVGTIQKFLNEEGIQTKHAIARAQDTPKYTKKVLEELREGLPKGISIEETRPGSGKYYYKIMLKGGKANKPTYRKSMVANEANKKLIIEDFNRVSKEYYPGRITDDEFKKLRLENKDMTTEQFAKFLDDKGKTTYLGDKWNKSSVSSIQNRLNIGKGTTGPLTIRTVDEAKKIIRQQPGAKFFFMGNPSDSEITQYASNIISQEKLGGKGGLRGFPIGGTKEGKMFRNFYDSSLKSDGRMKLLTDKPIDADGNVDWKMKDKNGIPAWKKAKFYDNKTGATYTWGKDYKPGDLRKQVDAAYGDGFFAKSVKVYDDQAKMNKMTFKGKALNEWMREGLLQKEFELKYNRKPTPTELKEWYALRKPSFSFTEAHHVEGVGKNPFRMEVSYRAANRKQNNLLSKYNSGTLTKDEYIKEMENLSDTKGGIRYKTDGRFIGQTGTPKKIVTAAGKDAGFSEKKINEIIAYITDTTGQVKQPMLSSGFAGAFEMLSDDLKPVLNNPKFKAFAKTVVNTPGKFFGIGDVVLGFLDYQNNISQGMTEERAKKLAYQAMSFGAWKVGDQEYIKELKDTYIKNGGDESVFDQVISLNKQNSELVSLVEKTKEQYKTQSENEKTYGTAGGPEAIKFQLSVPSASDTLKTNLSAIKNKAEKMDKDFTTFKETYTGEDLTQPSKDIKSAAFENLTKERLKAFDTKSLQSDPEVGSVWNSLRTNLLNTQSIPRTITTAVDFFNPFTPLPKLDDLKSDRARYEDQLKEMKEKYPREFYLHNLRRGMDRDNPITFDASMNLMSKPELGFSVPKAEGGITTLRSKYEYKK